MKNTIMVKHVKNMEGLKRLLNRLDVDSNVSDVVWQPGTMGFYVAYRVKDPGYNIGNRSEEDDPLLLNLVKTGGNRYVVDRVGLPGSPIVGNGDSPLAAIGALFWHGANEFRIRYTPRAIDWVRKKHPDHCYEESK